MSRIYRITDCCEDSGYRYRLDVSTGCRSHKRLLVIQLNPSRANGSFSDPTVGKVSYWAHGKGFGAIVFLNLFARQTPKPAELIGLSYAELRGDRNDEITSHALQARATIVLAWGKISQPLLDHYHQRRRMLRELIGGRRVHAVGKPVGDSFPRHGRTWNSDNRDMRIYHWENV